MSVFNDQDSDTIRSLALTFGGFLLLTVFLIVLAYFITT